jgi:hypothetical protein
MCTGGDGVPVSAAEALAMMRAGADYLLGPGLAEAGEAALGQVLRSHPPPGVANPAREGA